MLAIRGLARTSCHQIRDRLRRLGYTVEVFNDPDIGTVLRREKYRLDIGFVEADDGVWKEAAEVDLARPRIAAVTPNPFADRTETSFTIPREEAVRLVVYDVTGRTVRTLVDGPLEAGAHRVAWDGRAASGDRAAAGVYFFRLDTKAGTSNRKVVKIQ